MAPVTTRRHVPEPELVAGLPEVKRSPADHGTLLRIVARLDQGGRELPESCEVTPEAGIAADRWSRTCTRRLENGELNPDTQLTLMNARFLAVVAGASEHWPVAGDNLLVDLDLSEANLPVGQRLTVGGAVLEITEKPHLGCQKFLSRFGADALNLVNSTEGKQLRLRGAHARVIQRGQIRVGDTISKAG